MLLIAPNGGVLNMHIHVATMCAHGHGVKKRRTTQTAESEENCMAGNDLDSPVLCKYIVGAKTEGAFVHRSKVSVQTQSAEQSTPDHHA